jgi:hypothetical protein
MHNQPCGFVQCSTAPALQLLQLLPDLLLWFISPGLRRKLDSKSRVQVSVSSNPMHLVPRASRRSISQLLPPCLSGSLLGMSFLEPTWPTGSYGPCPTLAVHRWSFRKPCTSLDAFNRPFFKSARCTPALCVLAQRQWNFLFSQLIHSDYWNILRSYRELLLSLSGRGDTSSAIDSWRKIGWSLYRSDDLKELRDTLRSRLTAMQLLVSTANL